MSVIESLVLLSKVGTGIFSSSNLDTKLKYLFNSSHFLSSSYTISSTFFDIQHVDVYFMIRRESDTLKYKKQRNKVNNMKKKAKENFESNLDNILLDNSGLKDINHFVDQVFSSHKS
jgi:hypothetical protein